MYSNRTRGNSKEKSELDDLSTYPQPSNVAPNVNGINAKASDPDWAEHMTGVFSACNCCAKRYNENYNAMEGGGGVVYVCRWRYACKWLCGIGSLVTLIVLIIVFASIVPVRACIHSDSQTHSDCDCLYTEHRTDVD